VNEESLRYRGPICSERAPETMLLGLVKQTLDLGVCVHHSINRRDSDWLLEGLDAPQEGRWTLRVSRKPECAPGGLIAGDCCDRLTFCTRRRRLGRTVTAKRGPFRGAPERPRRPRVPTNWSDAAKQRRLTAVWAKVRLLFHARSCPTFCGLGAGLARGSLVMQYGNRALTCGNAVGRAGLEPATGGL
jgi:hypothetical protein